MISAKPSIISRWLTPRSHSTGPLFNVFDHPRRNLRTGHHGDDEVVDRLNIAQAVGGGVSGRIQRLAFRATPLDADNGRVILRVLPTPGWPA
jgi:hypothetical protein